MWRHRHEMVGIVDVSWLIGRRDDFETQIESL